MKFFILFLIILSNFLQAQSKEDTINKNDTIKKVTQFAVFPGCETYKGDNTKLLECFGEKLDQIIETKLEPFNFQV